MSQNRNVKIGKEAKESLLRGVNAVADAVKVTMGGEGKTVIIRNKMGFGHDITKDGFKVAQSVEVDNTFDELGASLIRAASQKTVDLCGDGTTTSTVITQELVNEGVKLLEQEVSHVDIREGMEIAFEEIVEKLNKLKKPTTYKKTVQIGTVSANGDTNIGKLVADIYKKIGTDSVIDVKDGYTRETTVEYTEGLSLNRGWALPYFCTDLNSMKAEYENAKILIYNGEIKSNDQIAEYLRDCMSTATPLVIVANDVAEPVMEALAKTKMQGSFSVLVCISPDFGNNRDLVLEDLAVFTGAIVGIPAMKQRPVLGAVKKITADKDTTVVIVENNETQAILDREKQLLAQIESTQDKFEKVKIKKRLSNLKNAVAIISVGGNNEMDIKEKKDRVDDCIGAVKSAIKSGYVAGGGATLLHISNEMFVGVRTNLTLGQMQGYELMKQAIQKPFEQILLNANLKKENFNLETYGYGVNVKTKKVEDLLEKGIIDSAEVVEVALESAKSVANLVLQTDCLISGEGL